MKNTDTCIFSTEWATDKFILLMLAVFPMWTGFEGYANITLSKYLFFVIATSLWLVWLAVCIIRRKKCPRISKCGWCVIGLAAVSCISAILSPYGSDALIGAGRYDGLVSLVLYCAIFLGVSCYAAPKVKYAAALAFSVTVCCIVSFLQLLGHNPLGLFPEGLGYFDHGIKYSSEFLGNIGNVDVFAALLCLAVPIFFAVYIRWDGKRTVWFLLPGALALFTALESGVSSAKVGLAVSLVAGAVILFDKSKLKKLAVAVLVIAVSIGLASAIHFTADGVSFGKGEPSVNPETAQSIGTAQEVKQMLSGHFDDSYGSGRIGIWRQLLEVFPQRPVLGGGPGTVSDRISIDYSRYVEQTGKTLKTTVDNAHNEYLGYLMDDGVLGLGAYLAMIVLTLISLIKRRKSSLAVIGCGMAGYWAQSFFGLGLCLVLPVIWLAWGLIWTKDSNEKQTVRRARRERSK